MKYLIVIFMCTLFFDKINSYKENRYAREPNEPYKKVTLDNIHGNSVFKNLDRPFRMAKLNLVWTKAQHRLTETKLRSLYTDLKLQDKSELQFKQSLKDTDKDGMLEAKLRRQLLTIMTNYDLLEVIGSDDDAVEPQKFKEPKKEKADNYRNKSLFKDKKLNNLWDKAEAAGFAVSELEALKSEFTHYQEKLDIYHSLVDSLDETIKDRYANAVDQEEHHLFNDVLSDEEVKQKHEDFQSQANLLREKHSDLREGYDRLERAAASGPTNEEFIEPKVQGLWKSAIENNFSGDQLAVLKDELLHFQTRLLKLRHMYAEHALAKEKHKFTKEGHKEDKLVEMQKHLKKQARKVGKLEEEIEKRIFTHVEL